MSTQDDIAAYRQKITKQFDTAVDNWEEDMKHLTAEQRQEIIALRTEMPADEIAKKFGVSESTVHYTFRKDPAYTPRAYTRHADRSPKQTKIAKTTKIVISIEVPIQKLDAIMQILKEA